MTAYGILENLISDILFVVLGIGLAWLWIFFTQRRKLIDFFDVGHTKRLVIYLSNIRVIEFGAVGIAGKKMSYKGEALANGEIQAAYQFRRLFSFLIPSLAEVSQTIGTLLLSDVEVQIQISPLTTAQLDSQASIISLGSGAYNAASSFIEETAKGIVKFRYGMMSISDLERFTPYTPGSALSSTDPGYTYPGGTASFPLPSGTFVPQTPYTSHTEGQPPEPPAILVDEIPPILDTTYGFIERVRDEHKRSLFYVAGMSEYATNGAARQLAVDWSRLYDKYGRDKPFLIMFRFDTSEPGKFSVVFEKELPEKISPLPGPHMMSNDGEIKA